MREARRQAELASGSPNARWKAFFRRRNAPATVSGRLAYLGETFVAPIDKASSTAAEVILPSCASARKASPVARPSPRFGDGRASRGVCSTTELNSLTAQLPRGEGLPELHQCACCASLDARRATPPARWHRWPLLRPLCERPSACTDDGANRA